MEALREQVYTLRESLEAPIADVEQLEELLASPARWLGLLPSSSSQNQSDFEKLEHSLRATFVDKHLASIQSILLRRIYVDWKEQLEAHHSAATAFDALFMPSAHHTEARLVGLSAVSLILSLFGDTKRTPLHALSVSYALYTLVSILELHPPDAVYSALCQLSPPGKETNPLRWLDAVKLYFSIPDRVSNFAGTSSHNNITVPSHLHWPAVMQGYTLATVRLLSAEASADPAYHMLSKLVNVGFVSAVPPRSERSSFWPLALSAVRPDHIQDNNAASNWRSSISELSTRQKQILLTALLQHMSVAILPDDGYSQEHADRQTIVAAANMLHCLFGPFSYSWASPCIEREGWGISVARLLVAWGSFSGQVDALLKASSAAWIDVLSIERSSPDHRQCQSLRFLVNPRPKAATDYFM